MAASKAKMAPKAPHISEQPVTFRNWYQHLNWLNIYFVIIIPLIGFVGAYYVPLQTYTFIFAVAYYFNSGLGVTAGELISKPDDKAHMHPSYVRYRY